MTNEYKEELEFAIQMARKAGEVMHEYADLDHQVERKGDKSPVTIADKEINTLLVDEVKKRFPEHGVLGEEESYEQTRTQLWVCDPIDSTASFILHTPLSMFSLAFVEDGVVMAAVTYNPWTDELFVATKDGGATKNNQAISVSQRDWGENAIIVSVSDPGHNNYPTDSPEAALWIRSQGNHLSHVGGGVFKCMMIAQGYADGFIFPFDGAHDIAAAKLIVEEAGGLVTDLDGNEQRYDKPLNGAIISNGRVAEQLKKIAADHAYTRD